MTLRWEELTGPEFPLAVRKTRGVCLVPMGVLEKHGDHLPIGTDVFAARAVAERAAAREPAVLFPFFFYGQINEARHCPGTFALPVRFLMELLDRTCEEIARNGFTKIVLLNGHGGNEAFLGAFAMSMLERARGFSLYIVRLADYLQPVNQSPEWKKQMKTAFDYHGGEAETSMLMAIRPDRVDLRRIAVRSGRARGRLRSLGELLVPIRWYSEFPDHYAGDARPATKAKGEFLLDGYVRHVAEALRMVKADTVAPALDARFHRGTQHGRRPAGNGSARG